jgi:ligand-binding sensor domain-containing protein/class 3 adenylate cyclase
MKVAFSLFLLLLISSCSRFNKNDESPPSLFPEPSIIKLNIDSGYKVNPVTGDSIFPLTNFYGDTIIGGIPFPAIGVVVNPDSSSQPKSHVASLQNEETPIKIIFEEHKLLGKLKTSPIDEAKLEVVSIGNIIDYDPSKDTDTSTVKELITGKSISISGKKTKALQPEPKVALPGKVKEGSLFDIKYFGTEEGLVFPDIISVMQDRKGNIWLGSKGGGVSRFDGKLFSNYTIEEGLPSNIVWTIFEDSKSNIWFGTYGGGACRYDGKSFEHFNRETGYSSSYVVSIKEDKSGNIWFGTNGAGISRYDGEKFVHFDKKSGLASNSVTSILIDSESNIWITTKGGGVSKFNGKSFTNFRKKDGLPSDYVNCIFQDNEQNIWFGTDDSGACRFDGKSFSYLTMDDGLSDNNIRSIFQDNSGIMWFGFWNGKICKFNGESIIQLSEHHGFSERGVHSIIEDNSGNLWFGTNGEGAVVYDKHSFSHITHRSGISNNGSRALNEDSTGKIWVGTGGGLNIVDGKTIKYLTKNQGLFDEDIRSLARDTFGNLWIGSWSGGLSKFDGKTFLNYTKKAGISNNYVVDVMNDSHGNIWFGSQGGLSKYNGKYFTNYYEKDGLASNIAISIIEDLKGNIWFSSYRGVTKFDGKSFTHYTEMSGLLSNTIKSIYADNTGNIWFGSDKGLICFDGEYFTNYTVKEGLTNSTVQSIIEDRQGNIWCSTFSGLNKLSRTNKLNSHGKQPIFAITPFYKTDGLSEMAFMLNSVLIDQKDRIWWGSLDGLTMLDMNNFNQAEKSPKPYLRNIKIDENYIDYHNLSDTTDSNITFKEAELFENYPIQLELPYNKNHLTFIFSGIEWSAPNKVKYSYKIEDLDRNWSQPSSECEAEYRNLPPGKHKFKLIAVGESGKWSEPFIYEFTIFPPWWLTWWAKTIYAACLILLVISYVRFRTIKLKKRQRELETEVSIATEEIRKERDVSEGLLLNILPEEVAKELKQKGHSDAQLFESITVLFTDFKGFTGMSEKLSPKDLVEDLNVCFTAFDEITTKYGIEKIKTIGDAYMAAGGLPTPLPEHARIVVLAALEMAQFIEEGKTRKIEQGLPYFEIRIGIHTGPVVAGIVGVKKFQYDIWGDTVNTASRMESSGEVGKVNVSQVTYEILKDNPDFVFENRGMVVAKGKGEMAMWFANKT